MFYDGYGKSWSRKRNGYFLMAIRAMQGLEGDLFAFVLRDVIDYAVERFALHLILLGAPVLSAVLLNALEQWWEIKSMTVVEQKLSIHVFTELMLRSYSKVSAVHSGDWMMRIVSDADVVVSVTLSVLPRIGGIFVETVSAFCMLLIMFPPAFFC